MSDELISVRVQPAQEGEYEVTVSIGPWVAPAATLEFDTSPTSRTAAVIRDIQHGGCSSEDLRDVGVQLWEGLLPGELHTKVSEAIEQNANNQVVLQLELPEELSSLPWESVHDTKLRFVSCLPNVSLIHTSPNTRAAEPPELAGPVSILVVIPQGSGLRVEDEVANLESAVAPLRQSVAIQRLDGTANPDKIAATIEKHHWHVVHFIGHGRLKNNVVEIRVNDDAGNELWPNSEQFSALFRGRAPDICVLNCCYGGSTSNVHTMDQVAPALMDAGVQGVVAMRYAIRDTAANRFCQTFYQTLLRGSRTGRIGYATQLARKSLWQNAPADDARSYVTPLAHAPTGDAALLRLEAVDQPLASATSGTDQPRLPKELVDAICGRRCVVVVGTELVEPPLERKASGIPGLRGLIEALCVEAGDELSLRSSGPLGELAQLERVAEHFHHTKQVRELLRKVRDYYAHQQPSELHRAVASWLAPGIFDLGFDGLLERAFPEQARLRVVHSPDNAPSDPQDSRDVFLVLLRGTVNQPETLMLSEYQQLELSARLQKLDKSIAALTRGIDSKVLFLGTSPTDPLTRELGAKLLAGYVEAYFVSSAHEESDELFWKRFSVQFLSTSTAETIKFLTSKLGGAQ